jgi:sodium transport system permease protein
MNIRKSIIVYKKEIKDVVRDRKTLFFSVLGPMILYPVLFLLVINFNLMINQKTQETPSVISISESFSENLKSIINDNELIEIKELDNPKEALENKEIDAYIIWSEEENIEKIVVQYDFTSGTGEKAKNRVFREIEKYAIKVREDKLKSINVDVGILNSVQYKMEDISTPLKKGNNFVGKILPSLLISLGLLSILYPAIDVTVSEKERGTLETILTLPISKNELFMGKFLAVSTVAVISTLINVTSIYLVLKLALLNMTENAFNIGLSFGGFISLLLLVIPLLLFMTSIIMGVSLFMKSFKDAQNYLTPIILIFMIPIFVSTVPSITLDNTTTLIPILNVLLGIKALFDNTLELKELAIIFFSSSVFAFVSLKSALRFFVAEEVLFSQGIGFKFFISRKNLKKTSTLEVSDALVVLSVVFLLIFYIPFIKIENTDIAGLILQYGGILVPIMISIWYLKANLKESLFLNKFKVNWLIGTIFVMVGVHVINYFLIKLQFFVFPHLLESAKILNEAINIRSNSLLISLVLYALTPAICEELLFRGILLSSFKKKFPMKTAVVLVAVLFALFHFSVFRIVPTIIIGIVLTFIVYKTKSIYLGMIGHFLNNGIAVIKEYLLVNNYLDGIGDINNALYGIILLIGIIAIAIGLLFISRQSQRINKCANQ